MTDNQDNPGINVPPPPALRGPSRLEVGPQRESAPPPYCRAVRHAAWGSGACAGGSTQRVVPKDDARRRRADTHRQAGAEAYHNGSVPLHPQPPLSSADTDPRGYPRWGDRAQTRSGEEGVRIASIASLGN